MQALTLLRRLAVPLAAADVHLGDTLRRRALASFECATLSFDGRGDLAAACMALGELDPAVAILEADRWYYTVEHPRGAK